VYSRSKRIERVLVGILLANLAVVSAKFAVGLAINSLAVLGDGVHASIDAANNILAIVIIRVAAREPDDNHPYGHTKFETLGALAIVVFLSVSGFELVKGAVARLATPTSPIDAPPAVFAILVATLLVNSVVAAYETRRGRALHSDLLLADAAHTRADVFITLGVIAAVLAGRVGWSWADPVVALAVAAALVVIAYSIVARSVPILVDQYVLPSEQIRREVERIAGVNRAYAIRSRSTGDRRFAELTIAVDPTASVREAHKLADQVETRLGQAMDFDEITVHVEPC